MGLVGAISPIVPSVRRACRRPCGWRHGSASRSCNRRCCRRCRRPRGLGGTSHRLDYRSSCSVADDRRCRGRPCASQRSRQARPWPRRRERGRGGDHYRVSHRGHSRDRSRRVPRSRSNINMACQMRAPCWCVKEAPLDEAYLEAEWPGIHPNSRVHWFMGRRHRPRGTVRPLLSALSQATSRPAQPRNQVRIRTRRMATVATRQCRRSRRRHLLLVTSRAWRGRRGQPIFRVGILVPVA
jgi:hypothetical protein